MFSEKRAKALFSFFLKKKSKACVNVFGDCLANGGVGKVSGHANDVGVCRTARAFFFVQLFDKFFCRKNAKKGRPR